MNKKAIHATTFVLLLFVLMTMLCGCGRKSEPGYLPKTEVETAEKLTDEQALSAIKNYCYITNPDLEGIVNAKEYIVYWEIASSDEHEIVVLFRSYTAAQVRYYIDRATGDAYVTEYVPGITLEEQRTGESFNVRDYFPED